MKHLIMLSVLVLTFGVYASIDFYSYRTEIYPKDSLVHYKQILLGYTELGNSEIKVIPKGAYLDVTEDAWISSDVTNLNLTGLTGDYLFKGTIPVPRFATLVGLQTWKGDTLYRAGLYESKYITDNSFPDSGMLQQSLDSRIALLQKHTEVNYELTLTRIALGEKKHVRIRYLLRPDENSLGKYTIPVLFHTSSGKTPRSIKVIMYADNKDHIFTLLSGNTPLMLNDTSTNLIPYQSSITLQFAKRPMSAVNLTEFTSGPYKGNYLLVNTAINDSIVSQLSKPISTVFIWRWNDQQQMVEFQNQVKTLSGYALEVIDQAKKIKSTILELKKLGNHVGLIHTVEGQSSLNFCSKSLSANEDSSILEYLNTFNEMDMYEKYAPFVTSSTPAWVPKEINSSVIEQSRNELSISLTKAKELLKSSAANQFHHIVMLSEGVAPYDNRKNMSEDFKSLLDSITVATDNVQWRGVDVNTSFLHNNLYSWREFSFPSFSPITIQLKLKNFQQPYTFSLNQNVWSQALTISARTVAAWDSTLYWMGFDGAGKETATIKVLPTVYSIYADSALAKIWADDENHIAEDEEIYPGAHSVY